MRRKPLTQEQKDRNVARMTLYLEIWEERKSPGGRNYSEVSGKLLGKEPNTLYFDHLLEKNMYKEFELDKRNIILVTQEEQCNRTNGFPSPKHKELIEKAKKELL